jgi:hypothetical protein
MDQRAQWQILQGHRIPGLDIDFFTTDHHVPDTDLVRGNNISLIAVTVLDQGNSGCSVRVVFNGYHFPRHFGFIATKINQSVFLFMAAADMPAGNSSAAAKDFFRDQTR